MNKSQKTNHVAATAATSLLLILLAVALRLAGQTTYEMAISLLALGTLVSFGVSDFRKGNPRRVTGVGLRRLPRLPFWA